MMQRIHELLKINNLSPSQFADKIGIQRSGMSHILSGRNKPSLEFLLKTIKAFPDIDIGWLLLGGNDINKKTKPDAPAQVPDLNEENSPKRLPEIKTKVSREKNSSPEKKIERIVVLYSDKSFETYQPE